ncbi:MAG TPA: PDZ domain-containing protein, partial [Nitrospira sp.]|nr:PDZ domain-containing protein [Nitrospira sp.]
VTRGGAADRAGLKGARQTMIGKIQLGDVIISVAGKAVATIDDLMDVMEAHKVGDQVSVEIVRENRRETVPVTLQAVN